MNNKYNINVNFPENMNKLKEFSEKMKQITEPLNSLLSNICVNTEYFSELGEKIKIAKENPNSLLNLYEYADRLSDYFWTKPYKMSAKEMKCIIEKVNSDKEFDNEISKYFSNEKLEELFKDINCYITSKHRVLFSQIEYAFYNKKYALANNGILAIIDEMCTYYLINKGCTSRVNLFEPIIKDFDEKKSDKSLIILIMILNSNINTLYDDIEFNQEIKISTSKKIRRNLCQHGRSYSNKKIDTIMLLNTVYNMLVLRKYTAKYKNKLMYNRKSKKFSIPNTEERRKLKRKIKEEIEKRYEKQNE